MHRLVVELIPEIKKIACSFTKDHDARNDLTQDIILKCLENSDKIKALSETNGNIKGWIYLTARSITVDNQRKKKVERKVIELTYEDYDLNEKINLIKTLPEMMLHLTSTEKMWVSQYMEAGCNKMELQRRTNISRPKIIERIESIFNTWKQSDIYLEQ